MAYILTIHCCILSAMAHRTKTKNLWLRFPSTDTAEAIGYAALTQLATRLGMSETETVHHALRQLAKEVLSAYEPDDGDLTDEQIAAIRTRVPQGCMRLVKSSLF